MKIVGVCACTAGLAHTFMAQKIINSRKGERAYSKF